MNKALDYRFKAYQFLAEDGYTWYIEYPDIPACVGGGDSIEEALQAGKENIEAYFQYLKEEGKPIPEPSLEPSEVNYSGKLVLRLGKSNHEKAALLAEKENISINSLLNELIAEGLERRMCRKAVNEMIEELKEEYKQENGFVSKLVQQ